MAKTKKHWSYNPSRQSVPELTKIKVKAAGDKYVESVLKPNFIEPAPENNHFNYLVDIFTKWRGNYFYFYSKYRCPGPAAIEPFFEIGFARMGYVGNDMFNLSYMQHTEKWLQLFTELSLEECIENMEDMPHFDP